jgi:hypothetical protein
MKIEHKCVINEIQISLSWIYDSHWLDASLFTKILMIMGNGKRIVILMYHIENYHRYIHSLFRFFILFYFIFLMMSSWRVIELKRDLSIKQTKALTINHKGMRLCEEKFLKLFSTQNNSKKIKWNKILNWEA